MIITTFKIKDALLLFSYFIMSIKGMFHDAHMFTSCDQLQMKYPDSPNISKAFDRHCKLMPLLLAICSLLSMVEAAFRSNNNSCNVWHIL